MALGNLVTANRPDIASDIATFDQLRFYRASSQTGSGSVVNTATLVAGTTSYQYQDTSGLATDWYYHTLFNSSSSQESTATERIPATNAPVYSRQTIRQMLADRLGCYGKPLRNYTFPGSSGTTTGAGSSTTVVCSTFISGRWATNQWVDWFLRATSGTESGNERLVTSFTAASGTFTTDAWGTGVGNSATFELYMLRPSSWWDQRIDQARRDVWTPFRAPLDGIQSQLEYVLPWYVEDPEQVLGMSYRQGTTIRQGRFTGGQPLNIRSLEDGGCFLFLDTPLAANSVYFLEGYRHPAAFISDTDTKFLTEQNLELLLITACMRACEQLLIEQVGGSGENRAVWEGKYRKYEADRRALLRETGDWKRLRSPRQTQMISTDGPVREVRSAYY